MRKQPFKRPMRGTYVLTAPAAFTRRDVLSKNWPETKRQLLQNITDVYDFLIADVERAIRTKH